MYFHYMTSIKFIVVPTSDACIEKQLFGASGVFYQIGSHLASFIKRMSKLMLFVMKWSKYHFQNKNEAFKG